MLLLLISSATKAQFVTVSGTVYDITARTPLEAVSVRSTSGRGTITDSLGRYSFTVKNSDSIWFSLINKNTLKYAVDTISNLSSFDIRIHLKATELPEVFVRTRSYKLDSIQNRKDYQKYFDFKKPGIALSRNYGYYPGGVTVGLDLDEFINMFRFRRNRNMLFLQNRLIQQEQDKYINYRFSKAFVRKLTKLESPLLDTFMKIYRPEYDLLQTFNDLELGFYIQQHFKEFKLKKLKTYYKKQEE